MTLSLGSEKNLGNNRWLWFNIFPRANFQKAVESNRHLDLNCRKARPLIDSTRRILPPLYFFRVWIGAKGKGTAAVDVKSIDAVSGDTRKLWDTHFTGCLLSLTLVVFSISVLLSSPGWHLFGLWQLHRHCSVTLFSSHSSWKWCFKLLN